jgi:hypothetical protein
MYLESNPLVYFFLKSGKIDKIANFGATAMGVLMICIMCEFLGFIKWFISSRKRITSDSLKSIVSLHKDNEEKI